MAQIETWLKCDLKKPVNVQKLSGNVFSADNQANLIGVEIFDEGQAATGLTGSVMGYAIREDGYTVVMEGTLTNNKATVVLPASCYVVPGMLSVVVKLGNTTVGAIVGIVYRTTTDAVVDPGHVVPSLPELLAKIAECEAATVAANSAASSANSAASSATTAAGNANTATSAANTATTNANTATAAANAAAGAIQNMTVAANGLSAGVSPTVSVTDVSGHKHILFGIPKGDPGKDFHIAKTFASIAAMEAYTGTDIEAYDFAMIDTGSVEDPDTGKLYCYEPDKTPKWQYIGDLSGKQGIKGETGNGIYSAVLNNDYTLTLTFTDGTSYTTPSIRGATGITPNISVGTVTTLQPNQSATVTLDQSSTAEAPVFNFGIPKGETGTMQNAYGSTIEMAPDDSTKIATAIGNKADKVSGATSGNVATLDSNGNLVDSGKTLGVSVPADAVFTDTTVPFVQLGNCFSLADLKTAIRAMFSGTDNIANFRAGVFFTDESFVENGTYYGTAYRVSSQTNYRRYELLAWGSETIDNKVDGSVVHLTFDENGGTERWKFRKLAYDKDKISNNEIGIVVNGSKASVNVPEGQYVIVRNSTISGISDGLYKAASNVSAGSSFVAANLTSCSAGLGGEVASLSDHIAMSIVTAEYDIANNTNAQDFDYPTGYTYANCIILAVKLYTKYNSWVDAQYGSGSYYGDMAYRGASDNKFRYTPNTAGNSTKMRIAFMKIS